MSWPGVSEDDRSQLLSIDRAIGSKDLRAERRDHAVISGAARRVGGVRDFVGVEEWRAELAENFRDRAFARSDSARETNVNMLKSLACRFAVSTPAYCRGS